MPITNTDELRSRYQQIRQVTQRVSNMLVEGLSKDVLHEGARKLGVLRGDTLVFSTEMEATVLMDYCIYEVRRNGRNAVEQYLIDSPPNEDSPELEVLNAMQHAFYSVFLVESVEPRLGLRMRDIRTDETLLLADLAMASSAVPNALLASRVLPFSDFHITGGAALPIAVIAKSEQDRALGDFKALLTHDSSRDPADLIGACLRADATSNVAYEQPNAPTLPNQQPHERTSAKTGRNDQCPCGSGRKFKQCCMRR